MARANLFLPGSAGQEGHSPVARAGKQQGIAVHFLSAQLINQRGSCIGFVVMPDHVHDLVHFEKAQSLSFFMNQWKRRSSIQLKRLYRKPLRHYGEKIDLYESVWQPRYYCLNVFSTVKVRQKLDYMHNNPVKAGLVGNAVDWPYSSARWRLLRRSVRVQIAPIISKHGQYLPLPPATWFIAVKIFCR